jgi:hypothetical protein
MSIATQEQFRTLSANLNYDQVAYICSYSNGVPLDHHTIYQYKYGGNALDGPPQYAIEKLEEFHQLFPNIS